MQTFLMHEVFQNVLTAVCLLEERTKTKQSK